MTEIWDDPWFRKLNPVSKDLWRYINDRCDCAGFWQVDEEQAAFYIDCNPEQINAGLIELEERIICRAGWLWMPDFIKEQGNIPLSPKTKNAHKGIVRRLLERKEFSDLTEVLIKGQKQFLWDKDDMTMPSGNGKGNSKGNRGGVGGKTKLYPIKGVNCSKCGMPAVFIDRTGSYDHPYCANCMPEKVKVDYY